jgi:50S ribosomal protein L4
LQLADVDIISGSKKETKPLSTPLSDVYYFPPLDIPPSIAVTVFSAPGKNSESPAKLDGTIFSVALRKDIVHEVIRYQRHKARQPKKTKRMSEISGSNKKPWPQKGQGRSQVGHKRNSVWRGGQKAHGPVIRDYSISLNRKYRAMGMMIALAAKQREGNLIVFDKIACEVSSNHLLPYESSSHKINYHILSLLIYLDVN